MTLSDILPLSLPRFNALAGYARDPKIVLIIEEREWYATRDERLIGIVTFDKIDHDYGWVILGRDERHRFRAIAVNASYPSIEESRTALFAELAQLHAKSDESFYQGDDQSPPTDFFTPIVAESRLNPIFKTLVEEINYSAARGIVKPMMRFYDDTDGNFVEQFQTAAFDARLWELYLFATFIELGYARAPGSAVPDFVFRSPFGALGIEATTINPPNNRASQMPDTKEEMVRYLENFVPIKLARALRRKLEKKTPYWAIPEMSGLPFVIAIQDFHLSGSMRAITQAATEYVFGIRHSIDNGKQKIEWIGEHVWGNLKEKSGFFTLPGAENISAVIVNPQGTLSKFNRMGVIAGFGDPRVKIIRRGLVRGERDQTDPSPRYFVHEVTKPDYTESWVEGMVVLHNPHARIPLPPLFIDGASHEFLQDDGRIMSLFPRFHPYFSETIIVGPDTAKESKAAHTDDMFQGTIGG
ncbi:hypothetical protein LB561_23080 [Mesorhizobium sp. B292B1B]|uniref:hypothetical protein n=1 Tax=unclassified Mesorhizobium TaxID=325217 RepID=UPI0015E3A64B|nr:MULTISPECIES: hypothetical protein [unclassified Mesorhizobium]MCA0013175.1 hypothetical protein [Mesorhizobium sp. B294B1A1]MCA0040167.1 hypothetical protein [Mesorhizobium sp. B292B1B]